MYKQLFVNCPANKNRATILKSLSWFNFYKAVNERQQALDARNKATKEMQ